MRNGIAGIDHVIIGVRDLEHARMGWTRLGFTLTPRGRHLGQGTANYCVMFARDYLELLGFVTRDDYAHRLEAFLARREGAMSVAFAPARSAAEAPAAPAAARALRSPSHGPARRGRPPRRWPRSVCILPSRAPSAVSSNCPRAPSCR